MKKEKEVIIRTIYEIMYPNYKIGYKKIVAEKRIFLKQNKTPKERIEEIEKRLKELEK